MMRYNCLSWLLDWWYNQGKNLFVNASHDAFFVLLIMRLCAWNTVHALDLHFIKNKKSLKCFFHECIRKYNASNPPQLTFIILILQQERGVQLDQEACHSAACCIQGYHVNLTSQYSVFRKHHEHGYLCSCHEIRNQTLWKSIMTFSCCTVGKIIWDII